MAPMIDPGSSIPELIRFIRYSFRECEFDEVQNVLLEREKSMKAEMENVVRDRDELKKQVDFLEKSKGYTELEKCDLEEKLVRSQSRVEEMDKMISQKNVKFERLQSEKEGIEEKLARSSEKCKEMDGRLFEMGKEIEELRRESLSVNKTIEELQAKEIEADRIVQELKRKNVEAVQTIDELRAKKMKSDKAVEFYENDLDPRILNLQRVVAKMLSVNVEDLATLANGSDVFAAAATDAEVVENLENDEVNSDAEDKAIVSSEVPTVSGSHASAMQSGGEVPEEKTVASSSAAGNAVIVVSDSDNDDETSIPDTSSGQRNKDRKDSREDSPMRSTKKVKISTSATPSRCTSLPSRVEERAGALQKSRTIDCVDSTDSDDESISDAYMNNLVAKGPTKKDMTGQEHLLACRRSDESPIWRSAPAISSRVPASEAAIVSSAPPSPRDSVAPTPHAGLEMEITDMTVDTASDPLQGSEPTRTTDIDDQEQEELVEVDRPFKRLRRVAEFSSPPLTLPLPVVKGIAIREPLDFTPSEAAFSGKSKSPVETGPSVSAISVRFRGNLIDLTQEQCSELLGHLGTEADVASVAQYSIGQTRDIFCSHLLSVILGIQAYHARLSDYERELNLSREMHQSCFRELEVKNQALEAKDLELSQAMTRIAELERRLVDSETDVRTLLETLARSDQEHVVALEKCKADHDLAMRIFSSNALQQGREEAQQHGLVAGIKFCRQHILATPVGQRFLQILQTELVEAYLCTPAFMSRMSRAIYHFEGYAIEATLGAAREFLGATGELTGNQIDVILRATPSYPGFQTDESMAQDFAWWLEPMRKAARSFVEEPLDSSNLLHLHHIPLLVLPYYTADLHAFAASHTSTNEVREMARACSSVNSESRTSVSEQLVGNVERSKQATPKAGSCGRYICC